MLRDLEAEDDRAMVSVLARPVEFAGGELQGA